MNKVDLRNGLDYCRNYMISQLTQYVLEHGEEMCDYYRNEHGIDDDEVLKLINLADCGCYFSLPQKFQAENDEDDYEHYAFWTLYVVKEDDDEIRLKYYCFYNNGFDFDEAQPSSQFIIESFVPEICFGNIYKPVLTNVNKFTFTRN